MIIETNQIELGNTVVDAFTGFRGTVTGVSKFATGCSQLLVQPRSEKAEDGKPTKYEEPRWFDSDRLSVTGVDDEVTKIVRRTEAPMEPTKPVSKGGERYAGSEYPNSYR